MHKGVRIAVVCFALLVVAGPATPAAAQSLSGTITGTVRDQQSAVLPGATVTLTGRQGSQTQITDADGRFRFPAVDVGTYELTVDLAGFQSVQRREIVISSGRQVTIDDIAMPVRTLQETITVTGESPVVDVKSSATETTISQDLLYSAPITRTAINVLNYAPGINNSSAYGGEAGSANALLIDGVDTRDPSGGTAWTFYNYNIVEEIQFQGLGAPAEYGAFTGAVVNTITKSGGNRFSGLFEVLGTNKSFAGDNITNEIRTANPALGESSKTTKYVDITGQLGGPLQENKLFFFMSAQRFLLEVDPSGPVTKRHEVSPRLNFKVTWQPNSSNNFTGHLQYDAYNIIGRAGVSALEATDELTNREDAPEYVWITQWRHIFGANTFSEVKYTGWWGFYDLNPEVNQSGRQDLGTGLFSVSQGWFYYADRERDQVNASLSHYADKFGRHEFKFGGEFERSMTRDRYGYVDDLFFYDYYGAPYQAYSYGYDITAHNRRQTVYAQDAWHMGDRLTLNLGVRGDFIQGRHPDVGKVFETTSWAPRVGFAWDLTGTRNSVLKGSYGHYYEGAQTQSFTRAVPGVFPTIGYDVLPDGTLSEFLFEENVPYRISNDLKHPRVDETTIGFERAITNDVRIVATGIWRENTNFIGNVNPSARWTPTTQNNGLTNQPIQLYRWANRTQTEDDFLITNIEGFRYLTPEGNLIGTADPYRRYKALMLVLTKRYTNRWQAQVSYVLSKATGNVDNTSGAQISSSIFETPVRALVNVDGSLTNDRRHEFKVLGSYRIPVIDVSLNTFFRAMSGRNYTPFQQYTNGQLNNTSTRRQALLEPRGSRRLPRDITLDLKLEKTFSLGGRDRLGIYADIFNTTNRSTITGYLTRVPTTAVTTGPGETADLPFETPGSIIGPRQMQIGFRWSF